MVDYLLDEGFQNISVLDISEKAIERAKKRLGYRATKVNWIVSDVTEFHPPTIYNCWHDRATFHFLTSADDINTYLTTARQAVKGFMTIANFQKSDQRSAVCLMFINTPKKNYKQQLQNGFEKLKCVTEDHKTPFNTTQNFLFCSFKRSELHH